MATITPTTASFGTGGSTSSTVVIPLVSPGVALPFVEYAARRPMLPAIGAAAVHAAFVVGFLLRVAAARLASIVPRLGSWPTSFHVAGPAHFIRDC